MALFSKEIFTLKPDIFGLDFTDGEIKTVQIKQINDPDKILGFSSERILPNVIRDGEILDPTQLELAINNALEKETAGKIKTRKVIGSIPESKAFLRVISIPKMAKENAAEAVKWEIGANIPMDIEEVYYDWQFIDMNFGERNRQYVLTVSVSKKVIDDYVKYLTQSGLDVWGLELESISILRSLVPNNSETPQNGGTVFVIDVGEKKTSFIVGEGNVPFFTSSIPFSGYEISQNLKTGLGASGAELDSIRKQVGIGLGEKNKPVFTAVKPLLESLAMEIEKTVDFYRENIKPGAEIEEMILSGEGILKGLPIYLAKRLKKSVELGNPWVNLELGNNLPPISREESLKYSVAIGLAMRGDWYDNKY